MVWALPQSKILALPIIGDCLFEDLVFFGEHLQLCPCSLALASSIPVLGLERVCPRKGCPWHWPRIFFFVSLALASSLVSSTPPLVMKVVSKHNTASTANACTLQKQQFFLNNSPYLKILSTIQISFETYTKIFSISSFSR